MVLMRSLVARSVVLAPLVLLPLAACQPSDQISTQPVHCSVAQDPPTRDDPKTPHAIVSRVRYWCDDPGAGQLALTLRMQRQQANGRWVDVSRLSFTASGASTVRTSDLRYRSRTVSIGCTTGTFRTTVVGSASGSTTRSASYDLVGPRSIDPCTPALPFQY
jgi:hypothetical protein